MSSNQWSESKLLPELMDAIQSVLHGASALIGFKDARHRYVYANGELEKYFGVATGALIGRTDDEFLDAVVAKDIASTEESMLQGGKSSRSIETLVIGERSFHCATVRFPCLQNDGGIIGSGFVAISLTGSSGSGLVPIVELERAQQNIQKLYSTLEEMKQQVSTDRLTGVLTRLRIEEAGKQERARLERYGHPVAMIFADLDHFKQINDSSGHAAGDIVLQEFCQLVRASIRATDLIGRWGGEEFVVLLPNCNLEGACLLADRICKAVMAHRFPDVGQVTASFGVAACTPGASWEDWLAQADKAMYRAKQAGRNRVVAAQPVAMTHSDDEALGFIRLTWRTAYESGNALIDTEHRFLFEAANGLLDAILGKREQEEITALLYALLAEIVQHFQDEEDILRSLAYPEFEEHCRIHAQLTAKAQSFIEANSKAELALGDLFHFIAVDVIAQHLLGEDRKFFGYLRS